MTKGERIRMLREKANVSQVELAKSIPCSKQTLYKYENNIITNIPSDNIKAIADYFDVSPAYIMGWSEQKNTGSDELEDLSKYGVMPIVRKRIPLLGSIACGEPIYASEDRESYVEIGADINADFCLRAKGDSMIGARIQDGDIVFIRRQSIVDNGDIAAVIIDDSATLKRVYYYPEKAKLVLSPENPKYEPLVYVGEELNEVNIIGKAVAFESDL